MFICGSVISFASRSFVILTVFFFARREDFLSRGFGHTRNGKKSLPKRVKPQRARRAQRLQRKNSRREPRIDPRKVQRTGRRQIPAASVAYAVIAKSALQSTFHHFPLVIFVLFVANLFLPDLYQPPISPCRFLVPAEGGTECFVSFVVKPVFIFLPPIFLPLTLQSPDVVLRDRSALFPSFASLRLCVMNFCVA